MEGLTEGRIVHFVMADGEHRPAIIVHVWRDLQAQYPGYANLTVFTDWLNDGETAPGGLRWETSVVHSAEPKPRTWHWIEKA